MSYFCKFCGKVLTTGDDIDRCNPDCSQKSMPVFEIEQISWDTLKYQNDQLKAENKRLRNILSHLFEACMRADIEGDLSELITGEILDAVQQTLNEVTK